MRCFANRTLSGVGRLVRHHERTRLTLMTINRAIVRNKDTKKKSPTAVFFKKIHIKPEKLYKSVATFHYTKIQRKSR